MCRIDGYWIVLNAAGDKYFSVPHSALRCIGDRLDGWKHGGDESLNAGGPPTAEDGLIDSLTANGILTRDSLSGKPFAESTCPTPDSEIESLETIPSGAARCVLLARGFLACATADWRLRSSSLPLTLASIERRRKFSEYSAIAFSAAFAAILVGAFKILRPLYPRPYLCLFDSIALLEFLARYHMFPRIVFGVVADPFEAHCWLQEGTILINDDLERVSKYKPIMSL